MTTSQFYSSVKPSTLFFQIPNAQKVTTDAAGLEKLVIGVTIASNVIAGRICGMVFSNDAVTASAMAYDPTIAGDFISLCSKRIIVQNVILL